MRKGKVYKSGGGVVERRVSELEMELRRDWSEVADRGHRKGVDIGGSGNYVCRVNVNELSSDTTL